MNPIFNIQHLFENCSALTMESLEKQLAILSIQKRYVEMRKDSHICSCQLSDTDIRICESIPNSTLKSEFREFPGEICASCEKTLKPMKTDWIGAGYSMYDHYHPRLLLYAIAFIVKITDLSLLSVKYGYHTLSNDKLLEEYEENKRYAQYLRRSEDAFDDVIPEGLGEEIHKNEEYAEVIEFEMTKRGISTPQTLENTYTPYLSSETEVR